MLDQELSLFSECLQGNSIQSKQTSLSIEDLQRVESIEVLYQKRIELGKIFIRFEIFHIYFFLQ